MGAIVGGRPCVVANPCGSQRSRGLSPKTKRSSSASHKGVPVIMRIEIMRIIVRLDLIVTITIDNVHCEWILPDRGHNLHVELTPLKRIEVGPVPVGEERGDGAQLVRRLHARDKLAVLELLEGGD